MDLPERRGVEGPLAVGGVLGHPRPPGDGVWQEHGRSIGLHAEELPRSRPCAIEHIGAADRGRRDEAFGQGDDVVRVMGPQAGSSLGIDGIPHPRAPAQTMVIALEGLHFEV